jgi:uncharacterized protein
VRELEPLWPDAPRYGPDEPFPPYRFVGGLHPHPTRDPGGHSFGKEERARHVPRERWREDRTYLRGVDLYHAGYLWEAHEQWESIWKASEDPVQRDFLQGLIQLAASLLKQSAGRGRGARTLRRRARERLERVAARHASCMGVELQPLLDALAAGAAPRLRL